MIDRMKSTFSLIFFTAFFAVCHVLGQDTPPRFFDAAPYGISLPDGRGLKWDDPREIHSVIVDFADPVPADFKIHLEYWGSHWPQQHLPKDQVLGSGFSGWMELGNWYNGG